MNRCDSVRQTLAEYVVGGLRRRERTGVERHLAECADCRAEAAALSRAGELLDALRPAEAPPHVWDGVRSRIAERAPAPVARLRWAWGAASAVAVVLVLLAVLVLPFGQAPEAPIVVLAGDTELEATMQGHLSAVWAAPLVDGAAVGLRLAALEENG